MEHRLANNLQDMLLDGIGYFYFICKRMSLNVTAVKCIQLERIVVKPFQFNIFIYLGYDPNGLASTTSNYFELRVAQPCLLTVDLVQDFV